MMKKIKRIVAIFMIATLIACGNAISKQPLTKKGAKTIEKALKDKFGNDAYYTDLIITRVKTIGNIIGVTVAQSPESLKMEQWDFALNKWTQKAEITIEIPIGTEATDFMFQLNDDINLSILAELVEKSKEQLAAQKNIEHSFFHLASLKFPKNGDISKMEYVIMLKPQNGGTTFRFYYDLEGQLKKMNY